MRKRVYFIQTKDAVSYGRDDLKILFSPSESKSILATNQSINKNSFCCKNLYEKRLEVFQKYQDILVSNDIKRLKNIFGLKDENRCKELSNIDIKSSSTCKAIQRYTGVAYNYLNYDTIPDAYKMYIDKNVIIFSNLFGPVLAHNNLPIYRLKQGSTLEGFKTETFYKENFSFALDKLLENEFIVDLRAGFYEKFYKIPYPHITMKFMKNSKVVSHWAKAYRGVVLRQLALNNITTLENFRNMELENLQIKEVHKKGLKTEFIYDIST
ncbi:MAG: peroxide stress protein YaaA [Sulfurospirillum sp.]